MKCFNLYYQSKKINRRPLTEKDVEKIRTQEKVSKIVNNTQIKDIYVKDCQIVPCTVV